MTGTREDHWWGRRLGWLYRQSLILLLVTLFVISLLLPRILVFIEAGEAGVLFRSLAGGVAQDRPPLGEGLKLKFPWDSITTYDVRLQNKTDSHALVTRDGLQMDAEVTFHYRPCRGTLPRLHQEIGPNYLEKLLVPEVSALLRQVAALCTPEQVFSTERADIENAVLQGLRLEFTPAGAAAAATCGIPEDADAANPPAVSGDPSGVASATDEEQGGIKDERDYRALALENGYAAAREKLPSAFADIVVRADVIATDTIGDAVLPLEVDRAEVCGVALNRVLGKFQQRNHKTGKGLFFIQELLVRTVVLPTRLREAIELKLQEKQAMLGYRYRVSKELLESLRKQAEGLGVNAFRTAVGPNGVGADYLSWQGIAATLGLAASPNSKIVVIGGKDGLPLILNTEAFPAGKAPPATSQSTPFAEPLAAPLAEPPGP